MVSTQVEGLPYYRASSVYSVDSSEFNSLESIDAKTISSGAVCWIEASEVEYRWDAASMEAPSDPTVVLPTGWDVLDPGRWLLEGTLLSPKLYDYVISSRADVVAIAGEPVLGNFTMPDGSYFITSTYVSLDEGEFTTWNNASITLPPNAIFATNAENFVVVTGSTVIQGGGRIENNGSLAKMTVSVLTGTLKAYGVDIFLGADTPADTACISVEQAYLWITSCNVRASNGNGIVVNHADARVFSVGSNVSAYGGETVTLDLVSGKAHFAGGLLETAEVENVGITVSGAAAEFTSDGVNYTGPGQALLIENSSTVIINGGVWDGLDSANGVTGVAFDGNSGGFSTTGAAFRNWDTVSDWVSGTQLSAQFCSVVFSSCLNGINWPSANVPTNGLLEVAVQTGLAANGFLNHTEASAGVNRKACSGSSGLYSETAIVP